MAQHEGGYGSGLRSRAVTRRRMLAVTSAAAGTAAFLAACSSSNNNNNGSKPSSSAAAAGSASSVAGVASTAAASAPAASKPAASAPASSAAQPVKGGTLHTYRAAADVGIDPAVLVIDCDEIFGGAYSTMHAFKLSTNEARLDLATKIEQPDNTTLIFTMRDGVKFQNIAPMNGRAMTTADAKYSWERLPGAVKSLGSQVPAIMWNFADLSGAGITVPDATHLQVKFNFPFASSLAAMAAYAWNVVAHEVIENPQNLVNGRLDTFAGSGPYLVTQRDANGSTLTRNPNYYGAQRTDAKAPYVNGGPYIDSIVTKVLTDQAAQKAAFESGQLDWYFPTDVVEFKQMQAEKKWNAISLPGENSYALILDVNPGPQAKLFDVRARQAVSAAIDRQGYIDTVLGGDGVYASPVNQMFTTLVLGQDELQKLQPFDPKMAKQLWQAAGSPLTQIRLLSGTAPFAQNASKFISDQLKQNLGVDAPVSVQANAAYLSQAVAPGQKVWEITVNGNGPEMPTVPEYNDLALYLPTGYGGAYYGFTDQNPTAGIGDMAKQTTALNAAQQAALDPNDRASKMKDLQRYIIQQGLACIPLPYAKSLYVVVNPRLQGFDPQDGGMNVYLNRQQDLWLKA